MPTSEPLVFLRGKLLPASQASINIYDAGVVIGATLTEMTRTFNHVPFRLDDHLKRLFRSLKYAGISPPLSMDELAARTAEVIEHNTGLIGKDEDLAIVHFVTPGEFQLYAGSAAPSAEMVPTVCVHTFPLPFSFWRQLFTHGAHVVTPAIRHVPPQCVDPRMKNRSRLHWFMADRQARNVDPKAISLLLDLDGNITETGGSNFVIVEGDAIVSPRGKNILDGVSLRTVRELALTVGMSFESRDLQPYDVVNADEAWLTTTPYCMAPATKINNTPIGDGKVGPKFSLLLEAWSRRVGKDIRQQIMTSAR